MKVKNPTTPGNTTSTVENQPIRKNFSFGCKLIRFINNVFIVFPTDSDNILNGNAPPIASQKAFNIIADSLRRIDVSVTFHHRLLLDAFICLNYSCIFFFSISAVFANNTQMLKGIRNISWLFLRQKKKHMNYF